MAHPGRGDREGLYVKPQRRRVTPRFRTHAEERIASGGCPWHRYSELGYIAWHEKSERLNATGVKQTRCTDCHLWLWPDEFGEKP